MKDQHFDGNRPNRDASQPTGNNSRNPFHRDNESRSDRSRAEQKQNFSDLSKPPQRDMTGRRVDVDDHTFGVEIW